MPGVVYVDVVATGEEARACGRLSLGDRVGLTGRLERHEWRDPKARWVVAHSVLIDQFDVLDRD